MLGFGNVNRTLAGLLRSKNEELLKRGIAWRITGVATRSLGWVADENGLDVQHFLDGGPPRQRKPAPHDVRQWLRAARADVLFEATSLNVSDGQPAIDHIRTALESGAHAITANKGPIVHGYEALAALATEKRKRFLFESTVMDGAPIFSMFREGLPLVHVNGFRGILNSTTNVILSGMESGLSFEDSLKQAQAFGIAETDPTNDIEGWDAAFKTAALIIVLMRMPVKLSDIKREGIANLSAGAVRAAKSAGKPYKLVCRAWKDGERVHASVSPQQVPLSDPLAWVEGTSSILYLESDIFPGLAIMENNPRLEATAYGMLADFVRAAETTE
ncbi:MAG TPA: homoserine dehydrogenase [Terriglobales bacterium]|nr:homoserine dehydrogenase [Terriglobales bacterium]